MTGVSHAKVRPNRGMTGGIPRQGSPKALHDQGIPRQGSPKALHDRGIPREGSPRVA